MTADRFVIWKHDCVKHGRGFGRPCDPPCDDSWQVDAPLGSQLGTCVATFDDAVAYVNKMIGEATP